MENLTTEKQTLFQSYLLGNITGRMSKVHQHLIQGENKEALSSMNDAMRYINEEVSKLYKPMEGDNNGDTKTTG